MLVNKKIEKNIGILTLDNISNLNALNTKMLEDINIVYDELIEDENVKLIILQGNEKAFSAGGDLRFIHSELLEKDQPTEEFYKSELEIVKRFYNTKKPTISFISGIVMGGGVGISIGSDILISDETTKWAMPENKIGIIPDVGIGYYFSKMEQSIGLYLSLTGEIISGYDLVSLNIVDFCISRVEKENIIEEIKSLDLENSTRDKNIENIKKIVSKYNIEKNTTKFMENRDNIDKYFNEDTLEEIFNELERSDDEFSKVTLEKLNYNSPVSLMIVFEKYFLGKNWNRVETVKKDLKILDYCHKSGNLKEGIRALMIDNDFLPNWNYNSIKEIDRECILNLLK